MIKLVLASSSPRRLDLLKAMGYQCEVSVSPFKERPRLINESSVHYVEAMAYGKCISVAKHNLDKIVIGADTIVTVDDNIFGKPASFEDFDKMMKSLSGREHKVYTSFVISINNKTIQRTVTTTVTMVELSDLDIEWYWSTGEPKDKAGGYAIQGTGGMFISTISGSCSSVIGLPQAEVKEEISKLLEELS